MNTLIVVLLCVVGIALIIIELFLIPGFGFAGIFGTGLTIAGVVCSYAFFGPTVGHITLISSIVLCGIAIYIFVKSNTLDKMALKENIDSKVDLIEGTNVAVGDMGITISRLAPMGKVRINGVDFEAKSDASFIDQDTQVEVVAVNGNILTVKQL